MCQAKLFTYKTTINWWAWLKRRHVYQALRPRSRTAKINFGFMFTIVYHGGLRPKLIFFDKVQFLTNIQQNRVWNVYPVFLWLMVFFQAHWGLGPWEWRRDLFLRVLTPMFKKINFGSAALLVWKILFGYFLGLNLLIFFVNYFLFTKWNMLMAMGLVLVGS